MISWKARCIKKLDGTNYDDWMYMSDPPSKRWRLRDRHRKGRRLSASGKHHDCQDSAREVTLWLHTNDPQTSPPAPQSWCIRTACGPFTAAEPIENLALHYILFVDPSRHAHVYTIRQKSRNLYDNGCGEHGNRLLSRRISCSRYQL